MVERSRAQLEAENKLLREQVRIIGALHMIERYHAYDAINNDGCPVCGARVAAVTDEERRDQGTAYYLKAVQ